jgi:hypothetical protein
VRSRSVFLAGDYWKLGTGSWKQPFGIRPPATSLRNDALRGPAGSWQPEAGGRPSIPPSPPD